MQHSSPPVLSEPGVRRIGFMNLYGLWTLYLKEVRRFNKVWLQTILAPAVTTLLFMAIFALALGGSGRVTAGINFERFLAPGLIMMAIIQNAFQNTTSSILISKIQGNIVDVLMPPLSPGELLIGFVFGGITRGLLVGAAVWLAFFLAPGVEVTISHGWTVLYFSLTAAAMLSLLGVLTGIWAEKFDHSSAVTNFIVVPLSLLSGTFYSIERLPEAWQQVSHFNPFFYLIDGFRYGFIGRMDGDLGAGVAVTLGINIVLWIVCHQLLKQGYRLKA
ncbi:MAG: ABC transporter permease [Proteobacteria bacterium]|nr:ABC transporter permease [Pseudomonadota bacterium]